jgi:hypothetical protein
VDIQMTANQKTQQARECVSVVRVFFEEVVPAFLHCVLAFCDVPFTVYERVVVSHQFSQAFSVLLVDSLVEP